MEPFSIALVALFGICFGFLITFLGWQDFLYYILPLLLCMVAVFAFWGSLAYLIAVICTNSWALGL